jgi:hypothetical protein
MGEKKSSRSIRQHLSSSLAGIWWWQPGRAQEQVVLLASCCHTAGESRDSLNVAVIRFVKTGGAMDNLRRTWRVNRLSPMNRKISLQIFFIKKN